jgi:phage terminase large subunit-like protein
VIDRLTARLTQESFLASPLGRYLPYTDAAGRQPQAEFHAAARLHRYRIVRGGNRSGKTTCGAADLLYRLSGWDPFVVGGFWPRKPAHAWAVGLDWEHGVGAVLWPAVRDLLPMDCVQTIRYYRRGEPEIAAAVVFRDGSLLEFKSADAPRTKFQGARLDYVWIDEEVPADIVRECRMRLVDRAGLFVATLTPVLGEKWVSCLEAEPGVHTTRLAMTANPFLTASAVASELAVMSPRERALRDRGDWVPTTGLVYPEFDESIHVVRQAGASLLTPAGERLCDWPLPLSWPHFFAIDFGFVHPCAVLWAALAPWGELVCYRLAYASGVRASRWAALIPVLEGHEIMAARWADHDADDRAELAAGGVVTRPATKEILFGILQVARRWGVLPKGRPRMSLVLDDPGHERRHPEVGRLDLAPLVDELGRYGWPQDRRESGNAPREVPVKRNDDACDALRYLVVGVDTGQRPGAPRVLDLRFE